MRRIAALVSPVLGYTVLYCVIATWFDRLRGKEVSPARLVLIAPLGLLMGLVIVVPWGDVARRLWNALRRRGRRQ